MPSNTTVIHIPEAELRVVFVLCDQMLATSVTLPMELLRAAQSLARLEKKYESTRLVIEMASIDRCSVKSHTGMLILPDLIYEQITSADIVYFPALWRNPTPVITKNRALLTWIIQLHRQGSLVVGVGTGCCFMAEAGLLEHRPATTHWHYFDTFAKKYPNIKLKRQHFITQSENIYCSGSVNSLGDLTVHFIQRYFGGKVARLVERHFFHEIRKAYDNDRVFQEQLQAHPDEDIIQVQIWLNSHVSENINIERVAEDFGMSVRNLSRRFKLATGLAPLQYLQKIRMDTAKDLLKTSNLSVAEIMYKVGYQDNTYFSALFKKHHDTTPRQYRTTVRSKLFKLN